VKVTKKNSTNAQTVEHAITAK